MSTSEGWYRTSRSWLRGLPPPAQLVITLLITVLVIAAGVGVLALTRGGAVPLLMMGGLVLRRGLRGRRRALRAGAADRRRGPLPGYPPPRAITAAPPAWPTARRRYQALQRDYASFECDPMAVLRLPALTDVTVPSTARFVEALAEAQALDSDREPPPAHRERFVAAVDRAVRAWQAARDAAERIRLSHLTPQERAAVERVVKLLTTARDSDSDAERFAAYTRARSELAKLERTGRVHLPRPASAALDAAPRGQLPPAP